MGEVYRARDTRLGRDVAIKVLPEHLSGDPDRRERFEREARAVSSLNHPHICVLHDIGSQEAPGGPIDYLVMEHLEGDTLSARLASGPLPPDQVLRFAMQIADALDKAHRQGVIHRDLKPANIMVTKSGTKLLDFGLAKLREGSGTAPRSGNTPGPSILPTATRQLTTAGTILGTFQYMAPEQLEGKEADARTDVFAFGVVVYEMATGRKAFDGASQAGLIASILKEQPRPIAELQPLSPAGLDRILRACIAKDPDDRIQTAHDVRMQLEWVSEGGLNSVSTSTSGAATQVAVAAAGAARTRRGIGAGPATAAALGIAIAMAGLGYWLRAPEPVPVLRVNLDLPPKTHLDPQNTSLALSPDGRTVVFAAADPDGKQSLWVRALDSLQGQPLAGTEDATYPFWSPDGRFIGFFADRKLKKIQGTGGTVQTLCDAIDGRGADWGADGVIVFAPGPYGGLVQVSSAGGAPIPLVAPDDAATTYRLPRFLPGGKRLLFFVGRPGKEAVSGIHALDLSTKTITLVAKENSEGRYVLPGYLVFVREGNLMAQAMDAESLTVSGEAVPIAERVQFNPNRWTGGFSFSGNGVMLYQTGTAVAKSRLTWFDLEGKEAGALGEPANILELTISPDARRAAATIWSGTGPSDIWMYDMARGVGSRFTFHPEGANSPEFSRDGSQLAYLDGNNRLYVKSTDGASEPRLVLPEPGGNREAIDWLPDGSGLLFTSQGNKTGFDVELMPLSGEAKPRPVLATTANERSGRLSPDGHLLLYNSDESGRREEYVVSYPGPGGKWQISTVGSFVGGWVDGGRRIIYADLEGKAVSVDITILGANLTIGTPRPIFGGRPLSGVPAITSDGRRLLMAVPLEGTTSSTLVLITDWTAGLQNR